MRMCYDITDSFYKKRIDVNNKLSLFETLVRFSRKNLSILDKEQTMKVTGLIKSDRFL